MELWLAIVGMVGAAIGSGGLVKIASMIVKKSNEDWSKQYIKRLELKLDKTEKKLEEVHEHIISLTVEVIQLRGEAGRCPMEDEKCPLNESKS